VAEPSPAAGANGASRTPSLPLARLRTAWARLRPLLGDRTAPVVVLAGASVGAGLAEAGVLALAAQVAAAMVVDDDVIGADLWPAGVEMGVSAALAVAFGLAVVRMLLQVVLAWLPARISADVQARLRTDVFEAFTRASWPAQADERDGHLQELMTSQIGQAVQAVLNVAALLSGVAMFATLTVSAFALSVPVALAAMVGAVAMFALMRPLNRRGKAAARELSQAQMDHAAAVNESVRLAEESHVFGTAAAHRDRVGELIEAAREAFFRFQLAARLAGSTYQSLSILLVVGGLAALYAVDAGDLASLGGAVLLLVRAGTYGQHVQGSYHALNQMVPYLDRIDAAVAAYRSSAESDGGAPLPAITSLAFDRATFAYVPDRPALRDVTFEISGGETIGVVGPSGAGKSTLVQLLLRLRQPESGQFLVNGTPASSFSRSDWQRRVAYVSQEPRVFGGTVADNIRYFRHLDDAAVERAARMAHIHDDIVAMPGGYDTVIGQRADAVSGGQRQRICLARALAAEPDLLVLDEPTSALDLASEAAVQASLAELQGRVTMVIIAHRISTLSTSDRLLVLADGAVEALAPARELAATNAFMERAHELTDRTA
jgi:ABC-type multidrug transport system fused ATPase/permease subunit